MEDRKYDRRCDTGSAFPLRTSTNQPTRSMGGSAAVPVLMKSSSTKGFLDEVSEKRRRECMSSQLRGGPSLPSKSLFISAFGESKAATASDLPTITGKKPLPKALLPKEARKTSSYQSVISGPFAFSTGGLSVMTAGPLSGMQRRSSISSCYPLRPSARVSNGTGVTENGTLKNRLQTADDDTLRRSSEDRIRRSSINTLSPPPVDVAFQGSLIRGQTSGGAGGGGGGRVAVEKENIDTGSIYPLLRMAFGKDENDDDGSAVIRRNPGRQGAGRKERPISYADPHSFRKMQEDMQTPPPEYMEHHPPSYDPPPAPTGTPINTHDVIVRSETSSISNKMPGNAFENAPNSVSFPISPRKSNDTLSQLQSSISRNDISQNLAEAMIKSPVTLKAETFSPYAAEPKTESPLTPKPMKVSTSTAGSNREDWYSPIPSSPRKVIRSPSLSSGSQERAEIFSPAYKSPSTKSNDSPFENMRKPRPAFSFDNEVTPWSVKKDSTKPDETKSHTGSLETDHNLTAAEESNSDNPPELPSSAPPPLPLTSHPSAAPVLRSSEIRHAYLEGNSSPYTIPENYSSKQTSNWTAVETVPPTLPSSSLPLIPVTPPSTTAPPTLPSSVPTSRPVTPPPTTPPPTLPSSAPPPLPVTPPPSSAPNILHSGLHHIDLENGSNSDNTPTNSSSNISTPDRATAKTDVPALSSSPSPSLSITSNPTDAPINPPSELHDPNLKNSSSSPDAFPENFSNKSTNNDSTVFETVPPALPASTMPPLPVTLPPAYAPITSPVEVHHEDPEHINSLETDGYFNEARHEHSATAEGNSDGMGQTESMGPPQQRQSLSSEEGLLEGHDRKSCTAQNRETMSPTPSDADSGIDCVKLEQKRSYETEYQTALWDEQSETKTGKIDVELSPDPNDPNIIDTASPDVTLSNVKLSSVEPQQTIPDESDCVAMSSPDVLPTRKETDSERNEDSSMCKSSSAPYYYYHYQHSRKDEDKSASSGDENKASSVAVPLDPVPPSEDQISTVQCESSVKNDVTSCGQRKLTTIQFQKGIMGLGFSVQGGKGSAYGDKALTVKKIFKAGDASVKEVLTVGDELISANGKDLTNCSSHEAYNYLKTLPDGTIDLVIGKAADV